MSRSGMLAAPDGGSILYTANGAFGDVEAFDVLAFYKAERGADSWSSSGQVALPRLSTTGNLVSGFSLDATAPDLSKAVVKTNRNPVTGERTPTLTYLRDLETGVAELISPVDPPNNNTPNQPSGMWGNDDFSHVFYRTQVAQIPGVPSGRPLYEYSDGELRVASVLPDGSLSTGKLAAGSQFQEFSMPKNMVRPDGTGYLFNAPAGADGLFNSAPLYLRENGETSLINASENTSETIDPGRADFAGANPDSTRIFFLSDQRLVDSDTDGNFDLYLYTDSANPDTDQNLTLISVDNEPSDGDAQVVAPLGTSEDGSAIYFLADGQLVPGESDGDGREIYRWSNGELQYLGSAQSAGNPQFGIQANPSRVTSDGRYLLLETTTALTPEDNGGFTQAYRYDADSDSWDCPSCMETGSNTGRARINTGPYQYSRVSLAPRRTLAEDGRVFFETEDGLLPRDINGQRDVYTWQDGDLELVSSGRSSELSYLVDASANGDNVFFVTRDQLVPQDQDRSQDLYNARVGGGFLDPTDPPVSCDVETCAGPPPPPPVADEPASNTLQGSGNQPAAKRCATERGSVQRAKSRFKTLREKAPKGKHRGKSERRQLRKRKAALRGAKQDLAKCKRGGVS